MNWGKEMEELEEDMERVMGEGILRGRASYMEGNTRVKMHEEEHGDGKMEADIKGDTTGGDHLSPSTTTDQEETGKFSFQGR